MRNLAQLQAECKKNGITVQKSGKRESKADYEIALRNFYWKKEFGDKEMPPQIHPMLARNLKDVDPAEAQFIWESKHWIAQEKIDGCRLLMFFGSPFNSFTSRRISDRNYRYNENTAQVPHLANLNVPELYGTVIDGEVQCPKARIDTGAVITANQLQATVALLALEPSESIRIQEEQDCWLEFRIFDILQDRGKDVTRESLQYRMVRLGHVFLQINKLYPNAKIHLVYHQSENKRELYETIVKNGGEGIMLKDLNAPYEPSSSRTKAMYKVKRFEEVDAFVTGFELGDEGAGWEKLIGKLEVSCHDEDSDTIHPVAMVSNMTFDERCHATACPNCFKPMNVKWENQNGKRVVLSVDCNECGEQLATLNPTWMNRVYVVRGQEVTPRVLRLKHAVIVSQRNDKAPEDCKISLKEWSSKFEGKAEETGIRL